MAQVHEYPVTVDWYGGRDGSGEVIAQRSGVQVPLSVPPEFQGPGEGSNPEELFTSAIVSCYTITLGIVTANRKIPVRHIQVSASGEATQNGAQIVYTRVVIRPTIFLEPSATDDHVRLALEMAHKADSYCIVTNAVRDKVSVEIKPSVQRM